MFAALRAGRLECLLPAMRPADALNRVLTASAGLIAVAALGTAVYSAWLARTQQRASVWPYVTQENSFPGYYERHLTNAGLGPALVRSFEVRVDGQAARDWAEVLQRLDVVPSWGSISYSDVGRGSVLMPGQSLSILVVRDTAVRARLRARVDRMATIICYCSLYDECWVQDSRETEPRSAKCRLGAPTEFAREHAGATVRERPPAPATPGRGAPAR